MNVLHISTNLYGGAGKAAYAIHKGIESKGHYSRILCLRNNGIKEDAIINYKSTGITKLKESFKYRWIQRKYVNLKHAIMYLPISPYELHKHVLVKDWADVIHIHWSCGFLDLESFLEHCKKKIVITLHDLLPIRGISPYRTFVTKDVLYKQQDELWQRRKYNLYVKHKDKITLNYTTLWSAKRLDSFDPNKQLKSVLKGFFFPIDTPIKKESPFPKNQFNIGFIADDVSSLNKGAGLVKEIASNLHENYHLHIIGQNGEEFSQFANCTIHGFIHKDEMKKIYSKVDILLFLSDQEAYGQVVLESLLLSTPVICTNSGVVGDVINHLENGYIIEDRTVEDIENALKYFHHHQEVLENMTKNAYQSAVKFIKNSVKDYEKIYS